MPNPNETTLIGRREELNSVIAELSPEHASRQPTKLFHLTGQDDMGKKCLFDHVWKDMKSYPEKKLLIQLPSRKFNEWNNLPDTLVMSIEGNTPELVEEIQTFQHEYISRNQNSNESQENETPAVKDQTEIWMELFQKHFVYNDTSSHLQAIFYLPDLHLITEESKRLFAQIIATPLARRYNSPDSRFIVTSNLPTNELGEVKDVWKHVDNGIKTFELSAFDLADIQKWLHSEELPSQISHRLLKESHGIPGKLQSISDKILDEENLSDWLKTGEKIFISDNANSITNLCNALLLPEITEETLLLFHGPEAAENVYQQLKKHPNIATKENNGILIPRKETLRAALKWYEKKQPSQYKQAKLKVEQLRIPLLHLNSKLARDVLTDLSPFTFFNKEVIQTTLGAKAQTILDFVHNNHHFFEHSAGNYKIVPAARNSLNQYVSLTNRRISNDIQTKIDECWHKTREKILKDITLTEDKIVHHDKDLKSLKQQARKISNNIQNAQDTVARVKKAQSAPKKTAAPKSTSGLSIMLTIAGVVILYFSILLTEEVSIGYALLGLICLFTGVFLQNQRTTVPVNVISKPSTPVDTTKYDKNIHFMSLKKKQLHSQISNITSNIQRCKDQLKEYDNLLRQPYN